MKTEESNTLIAEFMELTPIETFGRYSVSHNHSVCREDTPEKALEGFGSVAHYHTSWEWLMPVVEKIESLHHPVTIEEVYCTIRAQKQGFEYFDTGGGNFTKLSATYQAVVEFIRWFNEYEK